MSHRPWRSQTPRTASTSNGLPSVWAKNDRPGPRPDGARELLDVDVCGVRARRRRTPGRHRTARSGATVVGNPAATVMTSSPRRIRRSPSLSDVSAMKASRLADEPGVDEQAVPHSEVGREFVLEALRVAPVGQPEVERRVDEQVELLGAEDAAAVGARVSRPGANGSGLPHVAAWYSRTSSRIACPQLVAGWPGVTSPSPPAPRSASLRGRCRVRRHVLATHAGELRAFAPAAHAGTSGRPRRRPAPASQTGRQPSSPDRLARSRGRADLPRAALPRRQPAATPPLPTPRTTARRPRARQTRSPPGRGRSSTHQRPARRPSQSPRRPAAPRPGSGIRRATRARAARDAPRPGSAPRPVVPAISARTQSGTIRSSPQSPPPITLPARAEATATSVRAAEEAAPVGGRDEFGARPCWSCRGRDRRARRSRRRRAPSRGSRSTCRWSR